MNNGVLGKTVESGRKRRDTKLVTTEKRRNYQVSEPHCHEKFITEYLIAIEMKIAEILMDKSAYIGL